MIDRRRRACSSPSASSSPHAWARSRTTSGQSKYAGKALEQIGAPATVVPGAVTTKPANGNQQHLPDGSPVNYPDTPPAFGEHYIDPDADGAQVLHRRRTGPRSARSCTTRSTATRSSGTTTRVAERRRPDDPDPGDRRQVRRHQRPARQVQGRAVDRDATASRFPSGQHIAFTHWSVGGTTERRRRDRQAGRRLAVLLAGVRRGRCRRSCSSTPTATRPEPNGDVGPAPVSTPERPTRASIVSGYFNPLHPGHLDLFEAARARTGYLVVIVNNDAPAGAEEGQGHPGPRTTGCASCRALRVRRRGVRRGRGRPGHGRLARPGPGRLPGHRAGVLQRR